MVKNRAQKEVEEESEYEVGKTESQSSFSTLRPISYFL